MRNVAISIQIPDALHHFLRSIKHALRGSHGDGQDLSGDRDIEWTWVASKLPPGPGEALDFGCGQSMLGITAAQRGFRVTAVDLEPVEWPFRHERLAFVQGDILELSLGEARFDLVLNCSAIEHVGVAGRYGVTADLADGDLGAMARMRALMKPGGIMLLTIPAGRDAVFAPLHRVYGAERLPRLLQGFTVESREYWLKDGGNRWVASDETTALAFPSRERLYALGCFVLRRP